jgi:predicted amidohydrolase/GNAT superfamily N-acetyltransferase
VTRKRKTIKTRLWTKADIPAVAECQKAAYQDIPKDQWCDERHYEMQLDTFPEGQFLVEVDGKVAAYATSLIVQLDDESHQYSYDEITGHDTFSTHDPSGDTLYGADIAVHPDYRSRGCAKRLYSKRRQLLRRYNLRRMLAFGRMPGYRKFAGQMTPEEYAQKVIGEELDDPALSVHLRAGYSVKRVILDLFPDRSSMNYSTLLEMINPRFNPQKKRISTSPLSKPVRKIRVCAAQYRMNPVSSWDDFVRNVEFYADTAETYHCHFLLYPEYFAAQLFSMMPRNMTIREGALKLAEKTDAFTQLFSDMAQKRNLFIIGGSYPVLRSGRLYNISHLFTPSGNVYSQDKLHVTPDEREEWGITPGETLNVFDTPYGRIAIQVCYDIEFPETVRLLTLAGVQVIFVPFSTDERKAYKRIRVTAHARAIENYIYTVIAGCVGNLSSRQYLLNYGQAAVFTPSDFGFPPDAVAGEADPNLETVVIAELDFAILAEQRVVGSIRPLFDRRVDLYDLKSIKKIQVVKVE